MQMSSIIYMNQNLSIEFQVSSFVKPAFLNIHHSKGFQESYLFLGKNYKTIHTYSGSH